MVLDGKSGFDNQNVSKRNQNEYFENVIDDPFEFPNSAHTK